jgi:hypothetical protein
MRRAPRQFTGSVQCERRMAEGSLTAKFLLLALFIIIDGQSLAQSGITFTDLQRSGPERAAAINMAEQGIMPGVSPEKFDPAGDVTRKAFAIYLQRMFKLERPEVPTDIPDISKEDPAYDAIQAASQFMDSQILCFGCALNLEFHPDQPMSREDSGLTLTRVLIATGKLDLIDNKTAKVLLSNIPGSEDMPSIAQRYIATSIQSGILQPSPDKQFHLDEPLQRGELAIQLDQMQRAFAIPMRQPQ